MLEEPQVDWQHPLATLIYVATSATTNTLPPMCIVASQQQKKRYSCIQARTWQVQGLSNRQHLRLLAKRVWKSLNGMTIQGVNEVCFLSGGPWCLIIGHTYRSHHAATTEEEVCFFFLFRVICVRRLIDDQWFMSRFRAYMGCMMRLHRW